MLSNIGLCQCLQQIIGKYLNASNYIRDAVMETVQSKMLKLSEAEAA
jgi:hypothetical protein